ncbi:MAG: arc, partial [Aeromicrobium sp.]|nr:arc [Aeromicrobium sp.]
MTDNEPIQTSGQTSGSEQELAYLRAEVEHLRRRLGSEGSTDSRLADIEAKLSATSSQNERLTSTLREARDQIVTLKEEVDRLAQPPTGFGTFLQRNDDDSIDVFTGGRKLRVNVSPAV